MVFAKQIKFTFSSRAYLIPSCELRLQKPQPATGVFYQGVKNSKQMRSNNRTFQIRKESKSKIIALFDLSSPRCYTSSADLSVICLNNSYMRIHSVYYSLLAVLSLRMKMCKMVSRYGISCVSYRLGAIILVQDNSNAFVPTSLHTGHFESGLAALGPSKIITEAAVQAQDLQKRCPQLKAHGLKTSS